MRCVRHVGLLSSTPILSRNWPATTARVLSPMFSSRFCSSGSMAWARARCYTSGALAWHRPSLSRPHLASTSRCPGHSDARISHDRKEVRPPKLVSVWRLCRNCRSRHRHGGIGRGVRSLPSGILVRPLIPAGDHAMSWPNTFPHSAWRA
eukprot:SAG11_NODE_3112_length_2678_cov_2.781698_4_plen_150_part_00